MRTTSSSVLKTLLLAFVLFLGRPVAAQFVLDHVYPSGSIELDGNQLFALELEVSGWKYVLVDRAGMKVDFFHMDHSFWKSVSFDMITQLNSFPSSWDVLYISQHLFDLDDDLEFMVTNWHPSASPRAITQVVDEGTAAVIFEVEDQAPWVRPNFHQPQYPIYNTPDGTRLFLSGAPGTDCNAYVYRLAGTLTTGMAQAWEAEAASTRLGLFPNPASTEMRVVLPSFSGGEVLEILASNGQLQRTEVMASGLSVIDISALVPGTYVCRVRSANGGITTSSFVRQ